MPCVVGMTVAVGAAPSACSISLYLSEIIFAAFVTKSNVWVSTVFQLSAVTWAISLKEMSPWFFR